MAWLYLLIAGLLEIVWAMSLKNSADKFSLGLMTLTLVAMTASVIALYVAMRDLPLGVAYPLWTGIGTIGSVFIGAVIFKENVSLSTIVGVTFLIVGMTLIGLKSSH